MGFYQGSLVLKVFTKVVFTKLTIKHGFYQGSLVLKVFTKVSFYQVNHQTWVFTKVV